MNPTSLIIRRVSTSYCQKFALVPVTFLYSCKNLANVFTYVT